MTMPARARRSRERWPAVAVALADAGRTIGQPGAVRDLSIGRGFVQVRLRLSRGRVVSEVAEVGLGFPVVVGRLVVRLRRFEGVVGGASAEIEEVAEPMRLIAGGIRVPIAAPPCPPTVRLA